MLTIKPGLLFSAAVVDAMRAHRWTDAIVETDIAQLESGETCPAETYKWAAIALGLEVAPDYTFQVCRAAGVI